MTGPRLLRLNLEVQQIGHAMDFYAEGPRDNPLWFVEEGTIYTPPEG
ncbi:hypothetical protein [Sphingomonas sp.]|nr:hypothetical protein [Sphingomonas sp.]MBO9711988.1 hypothetical protein [Sphingomonas sp.]